MKVNLSELRAMARLANKNLKEAKATHKYSEGSENAGCNMSYDIGYYEGKLQAIGQIYNLRAKKGTK
jgi:hypothetical protein